MKEMNLAYCNECEDLVEFEIHNEIIEETYRDEAIRFKFKVGRCKYCGHEVATDIGYNSRRAEAKIKSYKKKKGLISIEEISEILQKYNVGKEALATIAGFGKATIKRYFEGYIPAKEYSDVLIKMLNDEDCFYQGVKENETKLKTNAYKKITIRYDRLKSIENSKIDQISNYIIIKLGEVTPLALQKLLAFSNGVNYALNGKQLLKEECQAWAHGYVYPQIYNEYKKYKYNPIDNGISSTHGCMLSQVSEEELRAIDMVINTFGLYSPKTLEMISHSQNSWLEKRIGYEDNEAGNEIIDEDSIRAFYEEKQLNSKENIMSYIIQTIKDNC